MGETESLGLEKSVDGREMVRVDSDRRKGRWGKVRWTERKARDASKGT